MQFRILTIAALAVSISGVALAQTSGTAPSTDAATSSRLEDKTMMAPFYTDDTMTTLRSDAEFSASLKALKSEDREAIKNECGNSNTQRGVFCDQFKKDSDL